MGDPVNIREYNINASVSYTAVHNEDEELRFVFRIFCKYGHYVELDIEDIALWIKENHPEMLRED